MPGNGRWDLTWCLKGYTEVKFSIVDQGWFNAMV
jgi:hypothetical protein